MSNGSGGVSIVASNAAATTARMAAGATAMAASATAVLMLVLVLVRDVDFFPAACHLSLPVSLSIYLSIYLSLYLLTLLFCCLLCCVVLCCVRGLLIDPCCVVLVVLAVFALPLLS